MNEGIIMIYDSLSAVLSYGCFDFQGVVLSVPEVVEDLPTMKRLWVHEVTRIYHDRISDRSDSDWFVDNLRAVMQTELAEDLNLLLQHLTTDDDSEVRQMELLNFPNSLYDNN